MKRFFTLLFFVVLFSWSFASANTFSNLFEGNLRDLVLGYVITNKPPKVTLNTPTDTQVVNEARVHFSWRYTDPDDDSPVAYILQLDEDRWFNSPYNFVGSTETYRRLEIKLPDGGYFWRLKAKDAYSWGEWSDLGNFYLDTTAKICEDGTKFWKCSKNAPFYCDGGVLVEDCRRCGCPANQICQADGTCKKQLCSDGTEYGSCSKDKPNLCLNGKLVNVCSLCGCSEGQSCMDDGTCSSTVLIVTEAEITKPKSVLEMVIGFFKDWFRAIYK